MKFTRTDVTILESAFARGGRRLSKVLEAAHKAGCRFDAWDDKLNINAWQEAFKTAEFNLETYAARELGHDAYLPWEIIDTGVRRDFLAEEYEKASCCKKTPVCDPCKCRRCGVCK